MQTNCGKLQTSQCTKSKQITISTNVIVATTKCLNPFKSEKQDFGKKSVIKKAR